MLNVSAKPGKLDVQKMKELGVPPGPLYGQIKAGNTVQLDDGTKVGRLFLSAFPLICGVNYVSGCFSTPFLSYFLV